ncbi:MAG TPA: RNA polymerase sigma factor [Candidatus Angelobacter sp.]|nr:RNA polymerase sigma factor [Candidatus Angelobacter sp.]
MKGQAAAPESPMANALPDEELMSQVRDGIGEMLGVLFDRYQMPLFNFYCKLTGDRAVSEDLVQDVFFRILKYRHTYAVGTPFRAWMYQIARNARVDHFRKSRPETGLEQEMLPVVTHPDLAQQKQETALLHHALMQMPEEKREVLVLARFQELKYSEIAELLGCEVNTVKVKVHRALQELRETFQRLERGGSLQPHSKGAGWPRPGSLQ